MNIRNAAPTWGTRLIALFWVDAKILASGGIWTQDVMSSCLQSAHTTVVLQFIRLYIENDWDMKWGPECKASATSALIQNRPNVSKKKNCKAKMKKKLKKFFLQNAVLILNKVLFWLRYFFPENIFPAAKCSNAYIKHEVT